MKRVLIVALLVLSGVVVNAKKSDVKSKAEDAKGQATTVLAGSITDGISGESLVGVEVKIAGTDRKAYTDFDGNFSFKDLKPGEYKLITNYISYKKKSEVLKLEDNKEDIKIKLHFSN